MTAMDAVMREDVCVPFYFVGDLNGQRWAFFSSMTKNSHDVSSFSTESGWLLTRPVTLGGTLDLLMTDVPDTVHVAVVSPMGNSDHSPLLEVILMTQAVTTGVLIGKFVSNTKLIGMRFLVHYVICLGEASYLLTFLVRF